MARKGAMLAPRSVTVTTTATLVSDATNSWASRVIRNTDASASVYFGLSTVTSSGSTKGMELKAGEILSDDVNSSPLYMITAAGSVVVSVVEFGN